MQAVTNASPQQKSARSDIDDSKIAGVGYDRQGI